MKTSTKTKISLAHLSVLPSFAQYLLQHRLDDFVTTLIQFLDEVDIPMMKFFKELSYEQLFELSRDSMREMLQYLAENKANEQIASSINSWKENQLPIVKREDIVAEDITQAIYLRRKTFLFFIQDYCTEIEKIFDLINEIDLYLVTSETELTNTYINILKSKIHEDNLIITKINETIPGAVYVFDVKNFRGVYSNNKLDEIIGYDHGELNSLGADAITKLLHPQDQETIKNHILDLCQAADGEIRVCKYRIRDKSDTYRWLANYESVFKRDDDGNVVQTIGITLNVDKEQQVAEALLEKQKMHEQAEALTHLGRYTWNLDTNVIQWSDELYRIYDLEPGEVDITYEMILQFNHPDDIATVQYEVAEARKRYGSFDFYYRIITNKGIEKILHARGNMLQQHDGAAGLILGTVQDETEKQILFRQLKQSEFVYQQAEQLANMGNWSWDIVADKLEWTDHLYHIYGIQPGSVDMTIDRFLSYVHPEDVPMIRKATENTSRENILDFTFRIVTGDGQTKIIHSVAQVQRDSKGRAVMVIGTERDVTEVQILMDKLQESEKLSVQAQALAHIGNWTMNMKSNSLKWSDEMYNIFELERNVVMDLDRWFTFLHPSERAEFHQYFESCMREKKLYDRISRIYLQNGTSKTVHAKGEFIYDENGHPVIMVGTTQDVTDTYRVQQELKENQMFISKITDATPSIIASYNINTGKYVFISEGIEKLLGYPKEEAMEQGVAFFSNIIHPDDIATMVEKNAAALNEANDHTGNDQVVEFTYRMQHLNGNYRWFHTYGTVFDRDMEGKVEHVLNITLDVTDQVKAAQQIKDQEHFIQQIADASPTILYLYDVPSQRIQYINKEISFVLGYLPEEILQAGSEVTAMLYHPDDYHLLPARKQGNPAWKQGEPMIQYECRMKHKLNEWRWLLIREVIFKTDINGNVQQILGTALDINRRKEMEKTILQNTLLLEQSNASLEEFAYVASHDLKEPLRKISTFGDRIVATQLNSLAPEGKVYMQKIIDASNRMQIMINDLLSISMISGNTSFETFSLQEIFDEVLQTLEYNIEQQNVIIKADMLPAAYIIPSQFRQLFQNLLSNSIKFIRPDVRPVITVRYTCVKPIDVSNFQLKGAAQYHQIEFADNGIGFEMEYAGKIFAIFQRLHGRSEYEGSGIGLAICKKIVAHHGGIIYATGQPDEGATFTILIPA